MQPRPCQRWCRPLALVLVTVVGVAWQVRPVQGHGRLMEPPSRSSMWRVGFKTEPNYNDNELFCGGYSVQWQRNGGRCGVCGDPWHQSTPRNNEAGGKYGKGIIVRRYKRGQVMKAMVQLTANHRGHFEFRLCPTNNSTVPATDECMSQHPLPMADTGETRYMVNAAKSKDFNINLKLPDDMTCDQCVFQWTYTAGNNWGRCPDGSSAVGCGPQETFRGCADIAIMDSLKDGPDPGFPPAPPPRPTRRPVVQQTRRPITVVPWWKTTSVRRTTTRRYNLSPTYRPHHEVEGGRPPVFANRPPKHGGTFPNDFGKRPPHEVEDTPSRRRPAPPTYRPRPGPHDHHPGGGGGFDYEVRPVTQGYYPDGFKPVRPVGPSFTVYADTTTEFPLTLMPRRYTPKSRHPSWKPMLTHNWNPTTPPPPPKTTRKTVVLKGVPNVVKAGGCKGVGLWKRLQGMDKWCWDNCTRGYCPATHCVCH